MSVETSTPRSRRAVIAAALGGLGAVIASRIATPDAARAAPGDPITVDNAATGGLATTSLTSAGPNAAFAVTGVGQGVSGTTADGTGLWGSSTDITPSGFLVTPSHRTGVVGYVGNGSGINPTTDEVGIYGFS